MYAIRVPINATHIQLQHSIGDLLKGHKISIKDLTLLPGDRIEKDDNGLLFVCENKNFEIIIESDTDTHNISLIVDWVFAETVYQPRPQRELFPNLDLKEARQNRLGYQPTGSVYNCNYDFCCFGMSWKIPR